MIHFPWIRAARGPRIISGGGPTTLFFDTFTDTNDTAITSHTTAPTNTPSWAWTGSGWQVSGNKLVQTSDYSSAGFNITGNADATITFTVRRTNAAEMYLFFRRVDTNNWFYLVANSRTNQLSIFKNKVGTQTVPASQSLTWNTNTDYTMGVKLLGSTITATFTGAPDLTITDSDFSTATTVLLYKNLASDDVSVDDFKVMTPASVTPSYLVSEDFEGTGTPAGWTQVGTVDWHDTVSPIAGLKSMKGYPDGSAGYGYFDFAAQDSIDGYFAMTPNQMGSYYAFLQKAGGSDIANNGVFRIYLEYNGSGSGIVQCLDGAGGGGSFVYLPNDTFAQGRTFHLWFRYERGYGVFWRISQNPIKANAEVAGFQPLGTTDLAIGRFVAGFYDGHSYKMDNVTLSATKTVGDAGAISTAPILDVEVYRGPTAYSGPSATDVHTLPMGIAAGKRAIFIVVNSQPISSITDSKGNTYSLDYASGGGWSFYSAPVTTALVKGDTITVNYSAAFSGWRMVATLISASNVTGFDSAAQSSAWIYGTSGTISVTTSAAALVIGGPQSNYDVTSSTSAYDGTKVNPLTPYYGMSSNNWIAPLYKTTSAAGNVSLGCTCTGLQNLWIVAVSYK